MTTRFYHAGQLVGGADAFGNVNPDSSWQGNPEIFTGTLADGITTITFSNKTKTLIIANTDMVHFLDYSLDNGLHWSTIEDDDSVWFWFTAVFSVLLRPHVVGEDPTYDVIATVSS